MKPYPNEELDQMSKREIIRLYKRTVAQFNDAVPVIRCKDCKYYSGKWCKRHSISDFDVNDVVKTAYDFCSQAERKEE